MQHGDVLIIFVRNPVLGRVKTRLIPSLGAKKALFIYEKLLSQACQQASAVACKRLVFYSDFVPEQDLFSAFSFARCLQRGSHLGQRMQAAFAYAFALGARRVVLMGSDCYDLSTDHLCQAFKLLHTCDYVFGPAQDGGYYLVGMKKHASFLFSEDSWGHSQVLQEALDKIAQRHLSHRLLETLTDIDRPEDVAMLSKRGIHLLA